MKKSIFFIHEKSRRFLLNRRVSVEKNHALTVMFFLKRFSFRND